VKRLDCLIQHIPVFTHQQDQRLGPTVIQCDEKIRFRPGCAMGQQAGIGIDHLLIVKPQRNRLDQALRLLPGNAAIPDQR